MTTHEEYLTYAQAKALKELGFDWPCKYHLERDMLGKPYMIVLCDESLCNSELKSDEFALPTQAATCRWLREEHGIDIEITTLVVGFDEDRRRHYMARVYYFRKDVGKDKVSTSEGIRGEFLNYEDAISASLNYVLKMLKGGYK